MTKEAFEKLFINGPVILDGATGTNLMKAGLPIGCCPEDWIRKNPTHMIELQRSYVEAGSNIVLAPTFTANRIKLAEYGLEDELVEINRRMVSISREAVGEKALVAGDLTMTGKQLYPTGDLYFEELVDVYKQQVQAILLEGVDLFVVETMMSLQECRAALLAIKESCDLPVLISLTYNEDGRTLFGTRPKTAMVVLQNMGADAVGLNCSTGPKDMIPLVEEMAKVATIPILAKPNAGLPELENGETVYKMTPDEFAAFGVSLIEAGASIIGGCCGSTPAHIKALSKAVENMQLNVPLSYNPRIVTSERADCLIDLDGNFHIVGERINPTGKKKLQEELKKGSLEMVRDFAISQEENGASILDINMGMNGIDEKQMMIDSIYEVTSTVDLPLCIDTSHVDIMEAALRIYPGRALINSISLEKEKIDALLPVAKKYGAMFVALPLSDDGIPSNIEQRIYNINKLVESANKYGLGTDEMIVDLLVATVGAEAAAANNCFATAEYCKNILKVPTICGLSNISFGLPQRAFVNTAFFAIALSKGLTMAIANPSQELLVYTAMASDMLLQKDGAVDRYLESIPEGTVSVSIKAKEQPAEKMGDVSNASNQPIYDCVVKGSKDAIIREIKQALEAGEVPSSIIDTQLIPAINEVGRLYDEKKYFLPQLIAGANAMKTAMEYLEPMLVVDDEKEKGTIVFATVEGDIHDIGKNLVVLMLKNYGYKVYDLGKDIKAELIVDRAIEVNADIIGLSALMTTTMMRMRDVVLLAKEKNCNAKIIIGGACITESFKDEIEADGYSEDAASCVRLVENLLQK